MDRIRKTLCGVLLSAVAFSAQAASLSLVYTGGNQPPGDTIGAVMDQVLTFDIVMNFTDARTLGGGFDVVFDPTYLAFDSFTNNQIGDDQLGRDPDVLEGRLESWSFADFNGLTGPDVVGSVSFIYLGGGAPPTDIQLTATAGIGGPFVSFDNPLATIDVQYGSATIIPFPLPAAVWFFISGLGALFGLRQRASA